MAQNQPLLKFLVSKKKEWEIGSITCSSFDIETGKGVNFLEIDYSKYDICITNPPFSKYKEFLPLILGKIDFILVAPFLGRLLKCRAEAFENHKLFLGFGRHLEMAFTNTDKKVATDWITSFDDANITKKNVEATEWTEYAINKLDYISTYDYEIEFIKFHDQPNSWHVRLKRKVF